MPDRAELARMESKHFLFCSPDAALIGDIAWHVSKEGHQVRYYIEADSDKENADCEDGFLIWTSPEVAPV